MSFRATMRMLTLFSFCVVAMPLAAADLAFTVNLSSDLPDGDVGDGFCNTNGAINNNSQCTLRAALMEANDEVPVTLHSITFSGVNSITLTAGLPQVNQRMVINGSAGSGGRVEINGANAHGCFSASTMQGGSAFGTILPQANNSRFENLVVRSCNSTGIALNGHGYVVSNCYIGVGTDGSTAQPNNGNGIDVTASFDQGAIPDLSGMPLPGELTSLAEIGAFVVSTAGALAPNVITGSVISGNRYHGIEIHGTHAANTIVFDNSIGLNAARTAAVPNGTDAGAGQHGVLINAAAWLNFIGLDNTIAGNNADLASDGIHISTGPVPFPNFVLGNHIGVSAADYTTDLGNTLSGINVVTVSPIESPDPNPNPTGMGAIIGPGNIVGYNGTDNCEPIQESCVEGGILVTGSATKGVRIWGNIVGITAPNLPLPDIGNKGDGINVVGTDIEIGGGTMLEGNVIGSNNRHGLAIRGGSSTANVTVRANGIGTGRGIDFDAGNDGHGIWLLSGGSQIGGPAYANERNSIAYNGLHGIKLESAFAYGNRIQQNEIYAVEPGFLPVDLDNPSNGVDATNNSSVTDRFGSAFTYTNWQQNTITLSNASPAGVRWELRSAANGIYTIEFYASSSPNAAKTFLCEVPALTVAGSDPDDLGNTDKGYAAGIAGCAGASTGSYITASVTDLKATSGAEPDRPGSGGADVPILNTSEFSASAESMDEIRFSSATYNIGENGGFVTITVERVGTGSGAASVDVVDVGPGSATAGTDYSAFSSQTLNWANADTASKSFDIPITDDNIDELNETIVLELQNVSGGSISSPSSATVTILDNESAPTVTSNSVAAAEGNPGDTTIFTFTLTLSHPSSQTASVYWSAASGSASQGVDFEVSNGTATFLPGETTKDVTVGILEDTTPEFNETFFIEMSAPVNLTTSGFGTGTIQNDDGPVPQFSIADTGGAEGNAGATLFNFAVSLPGPAVSTYSVDVTTQDSTAFAADGDYVTKTETLTFNPGDQTKNFTVTVNGDTKYELAEIFGAVLSNATGGAFILDGTADATISNDDSIPSATIDDPSVAEGNAGPTPLVFTVTLSNASYLPISIDYAEAPGGTATQGSDFSLVPGTLNFAAGETSKTITVLVNGDTDNEPTETFAINLSNPANAGLSDTQGTGTIINDDAATPTFTVNSVALDEGNVGTTAFTFTVTLNPTSPDATSVTATAVDGTATTADSDFVANTQVLNFPANTATQQFTVNVNSDPNFETNETFTVQLSLPSAGTAIGSTGTGTIVNDDVQPTLTISDVTLPEGTGGTTNFGFVATLSHQTYTQVTATYSTADVSAVAPGDYTAASAVPLTFNAGETSKPIDIQVVGDATPESSETFNVVLGNVNGATAPDNIGLGTIVDDDGVPTFSVSSVSQAEGDAGTSTFTFNVTLSPPSPTGASVTATTANDTATAGSDYVTNSQSLVFGNNEATKQFVVTVNGDLTFESNETFFVNLSSPSAGTQLGANGTGSITNDDPLPAVSIGDVTLAEGNAGTTSFQFNVTLSNPSGANVFVDYAVAAGTATAGSDYATTSGTVAFSAGEVSKQVTVDVVGETIFETDETFTVSLSNPINASIDDGSATGTITNDDTQPTITITDVSIVEGDAGATPFMFNVTLSNPSSQTITVDFAANDGTATTLGTDYVDEGGTVTFAPLVTSQIVQIDVTGDTADEPNETFTVDLSNPSNATIVDGQGLGTIINDDSTTPAFSVTDVSQAEGNAGTTTMTFTVSLSMPAASATSVVAGTVPGTATVADGDYVANTQTLNFPAGVTSQTFSVTINGDTAVEADETFTVELGLNSAGTTIADAQGIGTIVNDDAPLPTISISDVSQLEGTGGTTPFVFNVTLSAPSAATVTVDFTGVDGTATVLGADYADTSGTVTFLPGDVAEQITINVNADSDDEANETFTVSLTNPANATVADGEGLGTILNDDSTTPSFSVTDVAQVEGNGGTTTFTFTVNLSPAAGSEVSVTASTVDGTATVGDPDYVANTQVLTFPAGVTSQTFSVTVHGDLKFEADETFSVQLGSNSVGTAILTPSATGTIENDDAQPTITIGDVSQTEGDGATVFSFTVTLSNPSAFPVTVDWATVSGTATAGSDFTGGTGTLTFPPGSTIQTIVITILGDTTNEPDETFTVVLSNAAGATIVDGTATGTIINNDPASASVADIPALGGRELMLLSILLAAVALIAMKRT